MARLGLGMNLLDGVLGEVIQRGKLVGNLSKLCGESRVEIVLRRSSVLSRFASRATSLSSPETGLNASSGMPCSSTARSKTPTSESPHRMR